MAEETPTTLSPPIVEPMGNSAEARNPDGSQKDTSTTLIPDSEKKTEAKTEASTEAKPEGEKKAEPAAGAPEKYEPFKAPEGFEFDTKAVELAAPVFKELGLNQTQAQQLMDLHAKLAQEASTKATETYESTRNGWRNDAIADKVIGNGKDGLNPEVASVVAKAIDSLEPALAKSVRDAMTLTGAGDNPAIIRAFYELGKRNGEGTLITGKGPATTGQTRPGSAPQSAAQAMYPNLPSSAR